MGGEGGGKNHGLTSTLSPHWNSSPRFFFLISSTDSTLHTHNYQGQKTVSLSSSFHHQRSMDRTQNPASKTRCTQPRAVSAYGCLDFLSQKEPSSLYCSESRTARNWSL